MTRFPIDWENPKALPDRQQFEAENELAGPAEEAPADDIEDDEDEEDEEEEEVDEEDDAMEVEAAAAGQSEVA